MGMRISLEVREMGYVGGREIGMEGVWNAWKTEKHEKDDKGVEDV